MNQQVQRINHIAGATLRLMGRAVIGNGEWATPDNVASIAALVKKTGQLPSFDDTLTVADVLTPALATNDPAWTDDTNDARTERGFNFSWTVPASAFPSHGWYTIEVALTDSTGSVTRMIFEGAVRGTLGA